MGFHSPANRWRKEEKMEFKKLVLAAAWICLIIGSIGLVVKKSTRSPQQVIAANPGKQGELPQQDVSGKTILLSPGQSITIDLGRLTAPVRIEVEPDVSLHGRWPQAQPDGAWVKVGVNENETQIITPNGPHRNYTRPPGERGSYVLYPGGKGTVVIWAATTTKS
jgi:hypothetical protein